VGIRRLLDGTGPFSGLAVGAFTLGLLMLGSILLSPNGWQWWLDAKAVRGHEQDGIVSYSFEGQNWSIDDPHSLSRTGPRTVYVIAVDPGDGALVNTPTAILDWTLTTGPGVLGIGLVVIGFLRRSRTRHRQMSYDQDASDTYGHGIPSTVIHRTTPARHRDTESEGPAHRPNSDDAVPT